MTIRGMLNLTGTLPKDFPFSCFYTPEVSATFFAPDYPRQCIALRKTCVFSTHSAVIGTTITAALLLHLHSFKHLMSDDPAVIILIQVLCMLAVILNLFTGKNISPECLLQ